MPSAVLKENLLADATLTSSTEDTAFVLENLYDDICARKFAFTVTTGGWIEADLGSALAFDTLAIHNHNFDSGADIDVFAGSSPNPSTPVASNLTWRQYDIWKDLGSQTYRYVKIVITETNTANTSIGELRLGTRVALPLAHRFGKVPGLVDRDIFHETQADVVWAYHISSLEIWESEWRVLESQLTEFKTLHQAQQGRVIPYTFISKDDETDNYYARNLAGSYRPRELSEPMPEAAYTVALRWREESRGVELE